MTMDFSAMRCLVLSLCFFVLNGFSSEAIFCAENEIVKQATLHWEKEGKSFSRSKALVTDFFDSSSLFYKGTDNSIQGFKLIENAKGIIPHSEKKKYLPITKLPEGTIEGDVFVVKSDPPIVLVYRGMESFPSSDTKFPFFIYPYRTQMEINTFPPRYHTDLLSSISKKLLDSKKIKRYSDPTRKVSWISIRTNDKLNPFYTHGGFRGTEFVVYRLDKDSIP